MGVTHTPVVDVFPSKVYDKNHGGHRGFHYESVTGRSTTNDRKQKVFVFCLSPEAFLPLASSSS
jgi:hypothetical protein